MLAQDWNCGASRLEGYYNSVMADVPAYTTFQDIREHYTWGTATALRRTQLFARPWQLDRAFLRHDHDFWEIQICTKGSAVHRFAGGDSTMAVGDVSVLRPGSWHEYPACQEMEAYICCFGSSLLHRELNWTVEDSEISRLLWTGPAASADQGGICLHLDPAQLSRCMNIIKGLVELGEAENPADHATRVGYLTLLLAELAARVRETSDGRQVAIHPVIPAALRLLEEQMAEPWTTDALAERLRIDTSYLSRLFRKATSLPPMAYLARCRAERAAGLLLRTELPIAEIGQQVGWPDQNYFARRFRSHFGMTASAYRGRYLKAETV